MLFLPLLATSQFLTATAFLDNINYKKSCSLDLIIRINDELKALPESAWTNKQHKDG